MRGWRGQGGQATAASAVSWPDVPGDGERRAAREDADRPHGEPVAMTGGIEGEGEVRAPPRGEEPAQQGNETTRDFPITLAGDALVGAGTQGIAQPLTGWFALAEGSAGGADGALAGALGKERAVDPEGEAVSVGGAQVGEVIEQGPVHLVLWSVSAPGNLRQWDESASPIMPESPGALILFVHYLPLSAEGRGKG